MSDMTLSERRKDEDFRQEQTLTEKERAKIWKKLEVIIKELNERHSKDALQSE